MKLSGLYLVTKDYYNGNFFNIVEESLSAGVNILQYRDKTNPYNIKIEAGRRLKNLAYKYNVPFIVDDSPVLLDILDADGIHIGKDDPPFEYIKERFPGKIIGVSTYGDINLGIKYERLGADYIAFGSFFKTSTKDDAEMCDINILNNASKFNIPVFAIGGINTRNVDELLKYKISGIAVVSAIFDAANPGEATRTFLEKLRKIL
ncbi:thiamine phosphate synthase [Picrophilus oshimae]|uniref:Thiamine-phosphate synthase n=1 Tax=Picrophilus torridus (strain ATCC 700027 / DSM 9790 / JCM 10055 / NBRC 100828 / KAW 2/3) TaxID=1122961 RepID=THIE_PICTO|nr:thiamine phosphate synthase [Picrophilus oshimae]Q6KZH9.1 RecName: Full=Thiamine-phosphate synthase; Short=TP synthase; Short=TPS; AltName: Full=Thiamine-phosphate pyrophosphorylase; Short=TMP pyrophosphorylase; Short=TMP-PPase [Picrophilus oshimae DSM 9789]AAT43873.1 thiamin-phosphate pyrophosphorylase [Picrophilus oshimae DSM 9789]